MRLNRAYTAGIAVCAFHIAVSSTMPCFQDLLGNYTIFLQILVDGVYQNPCCIKSIAAVTQTCVAWHEFCRTSSLMARTWIVPGIHNAETDVRTQRLIERALAHATDAAGDCKFFTDEHGQLCNVLNTVAQDSIKKVIQLQMFLNRLDWLGWATLRAQTIVERAICKSHPNLSNTQVAAAGVTLLQQCGFTKQSHPQEFHHYYATEGPKAIRYVDVKLAHLKWKQFCDCTALTNGNLNMYFLIYVLDFLDGFRRLDFWSRRFVLALHGFDEDDF